jgi:hypothetical protein
MTNEMTHFIEEAIQRISDGIRGEWDVNDEAFLKDIISDGLAPLRVEIENFEAIERERDLLKDEAIREAAPELLAACKRALPWLSADYGESDITAQLREAIAKAEKSSG